MPQQFEFPKRPNTPQMNFSPRMLYSIVGILAALWVLSGIYTVAPDEKAVVLRFGKVYEVVEPGLHYHLPSPVEVPLIRSVTQVYREEIGFRTVDPGPPARYSKRSKESLMFTGYENIIDVEMVVQYRITDVKKALFSAEGLGVFERGSFGLVHDACEAALRQVIGRHTIDKALTEGKLEIQSELEEKLQEIFNKYDIGLAVETVQLQTVSAPEQVDAAFKDVASAKEDRERLVNEARGYQNEVLPQARGEVQRLLRAADAYKIERVRTAQGDADRFRAVYAEYRKAPDVTETRLYLETMEKILPRMDKYIIESNGNGGLLNVLNLGNGGGAK
jgi:membrane protease subunit HflK